MATKTGISLVGALITLLLWLWQQEYWVPVTGFFLVPVIAILWDVVVEPLRWWETPTKERNELTTCGVPLKGKVAGSMPPPYPNGWFFVMLAHELKKGDVRTVHMFGQDLVAFRAMDGTPAVVDAFCPHLGAHLGEGGTVVDNAIQCPFHAWQFDCSGACVKIPYAIDGEGIPKGTKVKSWRCIETNNMLLVYFHADNQEPSYMPVELPDINSGEFLYHGTSDHVIRCHVQEIPENGPDFIHLNVVHTTISHVDVPGLSHIWVGTWEEDKNDPHIAQIRVDHKLNWFGWEYVIMKRPVIIRQVGPSLVSLEFDSIFGKWILTQAVVPIEPGKTRLHHSVYSNMNRFWSKFVFYGTVFQVEQDIPIWNNKTFHSNPAIIRSDGPVKKFRRWYSQFYSPGSAKYSRDLSW
eukprot:TRINITY_DN1503_c0_g1_i1.p1 TRINITY_DN1503_c0_g1~~TRINITY_DN1503_c0_g1_i1.p1  ORF type:complete len:408 (+),score=60.90 TRINITY_DN1503_c0_g1_i1:40-1263(+)